MSHSHNTYNASEIYKDTVETTNSLKYALNVAYRTNETGIEISKELDKQDSQIDGMNKNLDQIDDNNSMAMRHIRSIKSAFGTFINMFSRSPSSTSPTTTSPTTTSPTSLTSLTTTSTTSLTSLTTTSTTSTTNEKKTLNIPKDDKLDNVFEYHNESEYIYNNTREQQYTNKPSFYDDALEYEIREQDKDLDELYNVITNIHGIGRNLNIELDRQNEKLKKVVGRVDEQHGKIDYSTKEINKLLL